MEIALVISVAINTHITTLGFGRHFHTIGDETKKSSKRRRSLLPPLAS